MFASLPFRGTLSRVALATALLYAPFLAAIRCPTLTVTGGRSWYTWDDLDARRAHLRDRAHLHFPEVGHMVHYEVPEALAEGVLRHLGGG